MLSRIKALVPKVSQTFERSLASKKFLYATFTWFAFQIVYIALTLKMLTGPDEGFHTGLIRRYATGSHDPFITGQPGLYQIGDVSANTGWLYHYVLSFFYRLSPFNDLTTMYILREIFLRLIRANHR